MAMGKYSRVDGRKSSSCCSTVTVVVVVSLCLVGVWMLMSSSVGSVQSSGFSSQVSKEEVRQTVPKTVSKQFEDSSGDLPEDAKKEDPSEVINKESVDSGEDNVDEKKPTENSEDQEETQNTSEGNQESNHSKESSDETAGSQQETKFEDQNGIQNGEDGDKTGKESNEANNSEQKEPENASGESSSKFAEGETSETEENGSNNSIIGNKEKDLALKEVFPAADQSEILNEPKAQSGAWSTQAVESQNEKKLQKSSISMDQSGYHWKVCNVTAGPDYIPCLDNWEVIRKLPSTKHYEHRERHCPDQTPTCLVSLPEGYKRSVRWPKSRDKIWYTNVPHTKLAEVKGHQNWVKVTGDYLTFPGGGTQFKNGALHYIDFIQNSVPDIAWGKRTRVILDVGCGVASFGGFLFERDVLAMSFAPKDEHEAQVQFALERGIPAILNVMGTKRLPYPSSVFDLVHCARCRVPWHIEGGKLLLELNRVLRPGGYFVWSATPVYQKLPEDVGIWKEMSKLTKSMCWELVAIRKDKINNVGAAIYRKPVSNECYDARPKNFPPLCEESDDPNAAWNIPLQACLHRVPVDMSVRGSVWPGQWPERLDKIPYWLNSQAGVYGKAAPEDFAADNKHWKKVVSESYLNGMGIDWSYVRNVMDMRAVYGGFAAALKDLKVWVMNVVPIDSPDTLPIIYERGLFGIYHDWCESFNTYPRTYDLLHADHFFSIIKKRCNLVGVFSEADRILRPKGTLILRDDDETIGEVEKIAKSLKWDVRMMFSKNNEGVLCVQKTLWRPAEAETIMSAVV